mgnify:CR=1 FL=1
MAHVIAEVEARIVDPDRMVLDRDRRDALPVARHEVQARLDVVAQPLEVHAAFRTAHGRRIEDQAPRHVHVGVVVLHAEEDLVRDAQSFVVGDGALSVCSTHSIRLDERETPPK